ncbi:hypothetical protein G6F46_010679 [Rhizopus delemar]|uniref:Rab-GAP TBC domain-containing protein n=3 Tax=Rhizopus TaxID=4842 RepID=I1BHD6_RHIO9|nr:hypothetical protein RO3G_00320 [Rhizopus delemar RA 99-880]KAG1450024.1 hypothetical protein G6F55_009887 [Rhizopus delemar]KAG1536801.1 hypothetical protein G6F51_010755 [Rhizopus arrhizus]KAG1493966.1 hypothetical protein G6F54_008211 [Rhizopus delemar]KAG1508231.1 hypothetical protein G6F53_008350 [Rhizopus delemar]|eukprot:EIE75616.1 hypothetical protein RO3G_00320 [Rhizopus delemar RA 99-880]
MTENELKFDGMSLLESKRQEYIVQVSLEVKPEQDSDTSGSEYEETSDMTEPAPIVSPDEDWQLVSNVESIKTLINIPNYYEMIMSKLNRQLKQDVRNNSKPLKEKLDTDWEFWDLIITDFHKVIQTDYESFRIHLSRGVPPSLRGMLWQLFSDAANDCLEEKYRKLLNEPSPHEKLIQRDLPRTFPKIDYFNTKEGQEKLFHVIKAYSLFDEQVGYCQGIHFLVGCLLLHMPEEAAFCVLVQMMTKYGLREQFTPKMDKLHERMFQFEQLLSIHLPQVHRHLDIQGVLPSMYASQWFMTLFAYRCPLDLVFGVFDVLLVEGADKMLNFALALIKKNEQIILSLEFESLLEFFNGHVFDVYKKNSSGFIEDAYSFNIPSRLLQKLSKRYSAQAAQQERLKCIEDDMKRENTELNEQYKSLRCAYKTLDVNYQNTVQELAQVKMLAITLNEENQKLKNELSATRYGILKIERGSEYQRELDALANANAQLVHTNSELQDRLTELETMMVELKLKHAEIESENKMIKKRFLLKII